MEIAADYDLYRNRSMIDAGPNDIKREYQIANDLGNLVHGLLQDNNPTLHTAQQIEGFYKAGGSEDGWNMSALQQQLADKK